MPAVRSRGVGEIPFSEVLMTVFYRIVALSPLQRSGMLSTLCLGLLVLTLPAAGEAAEPTYGERLGWGPDDRVVILHVDDAGMSHDSNVGAFRSILEGVATSVSVMMPCPWVPEFVHGLRQHPEIDAGLHLTLTAEWDEYRWGPLVGKPAAPGLVDEEGALWGNVEQVVENASPDEVDAEIRAQLDRARALGFEPTHLDSHMGTLFASDAFLERYLRLGIEQQIPVMFPGGHNTALEQQYRDEAIVQLKRSGEYVEGMEIAPPANLARSGEVGKRLWQAGLPVLDDLHNTSYGWRPEGSSPGDDQLRELKFERYKKAFEELEPGITMVIMHSTDTSDQFHHISGSGPTRRGDMLAMLDPRLARVIEEEGLILTTFRELMERRRKVDGAR